MLVNFTLDVLGNGFRPVFFFSSSGLGIEFCYSSSLKVPFGAFSLCVEKRLDLLRFNYSTKSWTLVSSSAISSCCVWTFRSASSCSFWSCISIAFSCFTSSGRSVIAGLCRFWYLKCDSGKGSFKPYFQSNISGHTFKLLSGRWARGGFKSRPDSNHWSCCLLICIALSGCGSGFTIDLFLIVDSKARSHWYPKIIFWVYLAHDYRR